MKAIFFTLCAGWMLSAGLAEEQSKSGVIEFLLDKQAEYQPQPKLVVPAEKPIKLAVPPSVAPPVTYVPTSMVAIVDPDIQARLDEELRKRRALEKKITRDSNAAAAREAARIAADQARVRVFQAENTLTDGDEVESYLEAVKRGEAGVNPRDQTAARSGDPYAQARVRQQIQGNHIQSLQNSGGISAEEAAFRRQQAEIDRQMEEQRIELERLRQEIARHRIDEQRRHYYRMQSDHTRRQEQYNRRAIRDIQRHGR